MNAQYPSKLVRYRERIEVYQPALEYLKAGEYPVDYLSRVGSFPKDNIMIQQDIKYEDVFTGRWIHM